MYFKIIGEKIDKREGAIVETVARGDEAYTRIMQGNFDLVRTDRYDHAFIKW